ncbi:M16 family metallopeptidase [Acidobacteriota bacterium]
MKSIVLFVLALLTTMPGLAQHLSDNVVEHTLDNGMKFLLVERRIAPVFAGMIQFRVGAVDEPSGMTGMAHMFEHMAFKGTPVIGTTDWEKENAILDEIDGWGKKLAAERAKGRNADQEILDECTAKIKELYDTQKAYTDDNKFVWWYRTNGGTALNAGTGADLTTYFVMLPANRLELWCLLESERLLNPAFREFYSERDVVMEERRLGIDTDPDGALREAFISTAFQVHPYRHPVVGWGSDVQQFTKDMAIDFFEKHYTTENAIGVLVGDIDVEEAKSLLKKYFGRVPAGKRPVVHTAIEPEQKGERRVAVEWDAESKFMIGYHKPNSTTADGIVLDVIGDILGSGRSSRLHTTLIKEKKLCSDIRVYSESPGSSVRSSSGSMSTREG